MKGGINSTLILKSSDIEKIVVEVGINEVMDNLLNNMAEAFRNYSPKMTHIPVRSGFSYSKPQEGLLEWMPLYDVEQNQVTLKMVGYHPNNPKSHQLPTIISSLTSYDTETGHLKAIMDGVFLTALRTGAASALASRMFAVSDSRILGLIGCGAQSISQLHALSRVFNLEQVIYYDIDEKTQESFQARAAVLELGIEFKPSTINKIIRKADIVCTATSIGIGQGPLFKDQESKEWLHINAVGSDFPEKIELPKELLVKSFVSPDFIDQAMREGECQQLDRDQIGIDFLSCCQAPENFYQYRKEKTVFDSTGIALEDQVVMTLFLNYAEKFNLGQRISIEKLSLEEKNPYDFLTNGDTMELAQLDALEISYKKVISKFEKRVFK